MVDFRGLCSIATFVIRTNDPKLLLQEYLLIEMQSDRFWNYLEEHKSGGVNYFINWGTLSNYEFDLPPLHEQKILADKQRQNLEEKDYQREEKRKIGF